MRAFGLSECENRGPGEMKTKILFWGAVLFLTMGLNTKDGTLYYFFAIHLFMLFTCVVLHKISYTPRPDAKVEPLPKAES